MIISATVTSLIIGFGVSAIMAGASYLYQRFAAKPMQAGERNFQIQLTDTKTFIPLVYGKTRLGIERIYAKGVGEDQKKLYVVGSVCLGEIDSYEGIWLDDKRIIDYTDYAQGQDDADAQAAIDDDWKNKVHFWFRPGTDGQGVVSVLQTAVGSEEWPSTSKGAGIAYIVAELGFDLDLFPNGLPDIFVKIKGKKVYDPRSATTVWSENPALCILDYLSGGLDSNGDIRYGLGADIDTEIDLSSFIAAANYCDEVISVGTIDPPGSCEASLEKDRKSKTYTVDNSSGTSKVTLDHTPKDESLNIKYVGTDGEGIESHTPLYEGQDFSVSGAVVTFTTNYTTGTEFDCSYKISVGGNLTASTNYKYLVTFVTAGGETTAGAKSKTVKTTASTRKIRLRDIPLAKSSTVTARKIYRSKRVSGTWQAYRLLATLSDNTTTKYDDNVADATISGNDQPPSTNTATTSQKRYTCNGIVDNSQDVKTNLEQLESSCRGKVVYESGLYSLRIKKATVPEAFELNEDNIIGDWKWETKGISTVCNVIEASFTNPHKKWETDYVSWPKQRVTNVYLGDDNYFEIPRKIDLHFTDNRKEAKMIAQIERKESRQKIIASCKVKEEALKLTVGSLVNVTHSTPAWTSKPFWVEQISLAQDGNIVLALEEYDSTVYDTESLDADTDGDPDSDLPDPQEIPDEISNVELEEELFLDASIPNWRVKVTYTEPSNYFWAYSEVYVKAGADSDYELYCKIDRLSKGIFYIQPVEALQTYYIKICSVSSLGAKQDIADATLYTITIPAPTPDGVTDLEIENRGSDSNVYGNSFKFRWSERSYFASDGDSKNSYAHQQVSVLNENIKYLVEVYYSGIPDTVKISGQKVNERPARTTLQKNNNFEYTVDNNIEDGKRIWEKHSGNSYYNTYYGIPQRTIKVVIKVLNGWSVLSTTIATKIVTNKAPDMLKRDGTTLIKPDIDTTLNGCEIRFSHPPEEYDINYFMVLVAGDTTGDRTQSETALAFNATRHKTSTHYSVGNIIYPQTLNGHCYRCTTAGTTSSTAPTFTKPSAPTPHPTINDGNAVWTHYCVLRHKKVSSQITVDSTDDEIDSASYEIEMKGMDSKKTFYAAVVPYDAYGMGTISDISASFVPGTSEDDTKTRIIAPAAPDAVNNVTISVNAGNNIVIKWDKPTGGDATDVDSAIIDWRAREGVTGTPTLAVRPSGDIPTLGDVEDGDYNGDSTKKVVGEKKPIEIDIDELETYSKCQYIVKGAKSGYTYFARVRYKSTGGVKGDWSDWAYNTVAVEGLSTDDMPSKWAMYKFTGSVTAENATQITWVGGTGVLKKKTNSGSSDITINTQGTPQTVSGTKYLCYVGTANLALKTEAELDADSTYVAIAKCTAAPSGKCKVLMMVSAEHFRISAYEAGFNQLSAVTADVGEITAGTLTGTTIQTGTSNPKVIVDSSGLRAYNSSGTQRVQISSDGSGWLGSSGALYWDTSGNLTVTGVVADSVAAEDIVAGTITGSTLQTASGTGQRVIISTSTNDIGFIGSDGGASNKLLCTIGLTSFSGDNTIIVAGTFDATNTRHAILAKSNTGYAIYASSVNSDYCVWIDGGDGSNAGHALRCYAYKGYGIWTTSEDNYAIAISASATEYAPIHIGSMSSAPTNANLGDIYVGTDNKIYFYNGSTWKEIAFV